MKIYTGGGDKGKTSLFSGERVAKYDSKVEAYGELDELSSALGYLAALLRDDHPDLAAELERVQSNLFKMGSWLATTPGASRAEYLEAIDKAQAAGLEKAIDEMTESLDEMKGFILPGGHPSSAWGHYTRTVCRRVERRVVLLKDQPGYRDQDWLDVVLVYMNRLSDYLFTLARYCNHLYRVDDVLWRKW